MSALVIGLFCVLGIVVFSVSRRITTEMSASAISNLGESLDLIQGTIETIFRMEAEHQELMAEELSALEAPEEYVRGWEGNSTMARIALLEEGASDGISSTEEPFWVEELALPAWWLALACRRLPPLWTATTPPRDPGSPLLQTAASNIPAI